MTANEAPQARWLSVTLPIFAAVLSAAGLERALPQPGETALRWEDWMLPVVMATIIGVGGRKWPALTVAVSALALVGYYTSNRPPIGYTLLLVPALIGAGERGAIRAAAGIGLGFIPLIFGIRIIALKQSPTILGVQLITEIALLCAGLLAGDSLRSRRLWRSESTKRLALEAVAVQQAADARLESERRVIARDIHDAMGQTLVVLSQQSNLALAKLDGDPEGARDALGVIRASVQNARGEVDDAVNLLLAPSDNTLPPPTLADLGELAERIRGHGIEVSLTVTIFGVGAAVEATAYRIVQEAMTNTERHSNATSITISVTPEPGSNETLRVEIIDNGGVAAGWTPGRGIAGMRERAAIVGGSLSVAADASSFRVVALLPVRRSS